MSIYGVEGSRGFSTDASLLFSSTFEHPQGESVKHGEFVNSDLYQHDQQQRQLSSSLLRYRSTPSSLFENLVDGGVSGGGDFPETETAFSRFVPSIGSDGDSDPQFSTAIKHDTTKMIYQDSLENYDLANRGSLVSNRTGLDDVYKVENGAAMENPVKGSNLTRQSSSSAGFFSILTPKNGFGAMRDVGNLSVANGGANGKVGPRLNDEMSFSSEPSSRLSLGYFMPQIAENGNECIVVENEHLVSGNSSNKLFQRISQNDCWNIDSKFTGLKRKTEGDEYQFSGLNLLESQTGDSKSYTTSLTHHLSLPRTSSEIEAIEKFLQCPQDSVPCKIRAKRGFATHPRSIAERMRRMRISERMRKLQDLFPNMDKQTNIADMLDLAVVYIKDLQKEVQALTDMGEKCTCSS